MSAKFIPTAFADYWRHYGGCKALRRSFYLWVSIALTALMFPTWTTSDWWDLPISILPNLLGFSLGAYAMLVSFGGEKFQKVLVGTKSVKKSAFLAINANFVHFVTVQSVSLIVALICKSWKPTSFNMPINDYRTWLIWAAWGAAFFSFIYAVSLIVAAVFGVFQMGKWLNRMMFMESQDQMASTEEAATVLKADAVEEAGTTGTSSTATTEDRLPLRIAVPGHIKDDADRDDESEEQSVEIGPQTKV